MSATTTSERSRVTARRWPLWPETIAPPEDRPPPPGRPLTILTVAYPLAAVAADAAGGSEQIISLLDAALVAGGHRSLVVAREGSAVAGTLIPTAAAAEDYAGDGERARRAHAAGLERALSEWGPDLVHMHGLDFHAYLPSPGTPVLATLHLPAAWYPRPVFDPERPRTYLNCVSAAQARSCPRSRALIGHVDNGVALDRFRPAVRKREYLLALGRICPEKGLHLALVAARRTGLPLVLAGEVFPYEGHRRYFEREIAPRLDASRRYVGKVGLERKRRLLAGAKALLVPSLVDETSSLVAMEALASGTPVIAFRAGALADIVEDRVTGYLVDDLDGIVRAIGAIDQIDPAACRRAAEQRFSAERMVNEYLRLYRSLASPISALAAAG